MSAPRQWIWWAISLQFLGYLIDIAWHGFMSGGVEPSTFGDMARHLATVHLPLYLGCACVLGATALALIQRPSQPAVAIAFAGAALSAAAEAWHAYSHLQLDTHHAPIAGILSAIGFVVVVVTTWWAKRSTRRSGPHPRREGEVFSSPRG